MTSNCLSKVCICWLVPGCLACEDVVGIDAPQSSSQITVNAFFTPDSAWQVELSENRSILDTNEFAAVPDATVQIMQQGQVVASLSYAASPLGRSIYRSEDNRPQLGEEYTLEVTHPSLGRVTSMNDVPAQPAKILSAVWNTLDIKPHPNPNESRRSVYEVTIHLDDPPEENFYSISLFSTASRLRDADINHDGELERVLETRYFLNPAFIRLHDPATANPFYHYGRELLLSDASFNGQEHTLTVDMIQTTGTDNPLSYVFLFKPLLLGVQENVYDRQGNVVLVPGDFLDLAFSLHVILRTTTEEYYKYNYTRDLQASTEDNPFAQPVQVFDNIEGGLGIFAGYNQVEKEVTIK